MRRRIIVALLAVISLVLPVISTGATASTLPPERKPSLSVGYSAPIATATSLNVVHTALFTVPWVTCEYGTASHATSLIVLDSGNHSHRFWLGVSVSCRENSTASITVHFHRGAEFRNPSIIMRQNDELLGTLTYYQRGDFATYGFELVNNTQKGKLADSRKWYASWTLTAQSVTYKRASWAVSSSSIPPLGGVHFYVGQLSGRAMKSLPGGALFQAKTPGYSVTNGFNEKGGIHITWRKKTSAR